MKKITLNVIRITLPITCVIIIYLSGHSLLKSIYLTFVTALFTCLVGATLFGIGQLIVRPVLSLYHLSLTSKDEELLDLNNPTNRVSLYLSISFVLLISLLIARKC
ncbi:MAG: hypothetical protein ACSHX6_03065 [Akkermansiaceae bacterium]